MYCPNCGKTNSPDQKFCRACGLSLDKIVQSLTEQLPPGQVDRNLEQRQQTVDRWLVIAGVAAAAIFIGGILWTIIYKLIIIKGSVAEGLGFLAFILLAVAVGVLAIYRDSLMQSSKHKLPEPSPALSAETGPLLTESCQEPLPSVTERTTSLLNKDKA